MVLRILKLVATGVFLAAFECTKFVFGRSSAPDPTWRAYSAPPDHPADLRGPISKGREQKNVERKDKKGEEGNRRDRSLLSQIIGSASEFNDIF